jgi:hypothetical protein
VAKRILFRVVSTFQPFNISPLFLISLSNISSNGNQNYQRQK